MISAAQQNNFRQGPEGPRFSFNEIGHLKTAGKVVATLALLGGAVSGVLLMANNLNDVLTANTSTLHQGALNFFSATNFGKGALLEAFSVSTLALLHTAGKRV